MRNALKAEFASWVCAEVRDYGPVSQLDVTHEFRIHPLVALDWLRELAKAGALVEWYVTPHTSLFGESLV